LIEGRVAAVFFGAEWEPTSTEFASLLEKVYYGCREINGRNLEVVFASQDADVGSYESFRNSMPWPALPYKDPRIARLKDRFGVTAMPCVVVIDEDGAVINRNAYGQIVEGSYGKKHAGNQAQQAHTRPGRENGSGFPWKAQTGPVYSLTLDQMPRLQSRPSVVLLMEGQLPLSQRRLLRVVASVASSFYATGPQAEQALGFFYCTKQTQLSTQVHELLCDYLGAWYVERCVFFLKRT